MAALDQLDEVADVLLVDLLSRADRDINPSMAFTPYITFSASPRVFSSPSRFTTGQEAVLCADILIKGTENIDGLFDALHADGLFYQLDTLLYLLNQRTGRKLSLNLADLFQALRLHGLMRQAVFPRQRTPSG